MVVCGETIRSETHGVIKSPGYPHNYPNNRDCVWTIEVQPNQDIYMHFGEVALEEDLLCYDYIEVRLHLKSALKNIGLIIKRIKGINCWLF